MKLVINNHNWTKNSGNSRSNKQYRGAGIGNQCHTGVILCCSIVMNVYE